MHIIDNFITQKFLEEIKILFNKYNIINSIDEFGALSRQVVFNNSFRLDLFNLYKNHYYRNLTIVEILATKQDLDIERQVINLVKNHITIDNITLRNIHLITLYISYLEQRIVELPETITQSFYEIERPNN